MSATVHRLTLQAPQEEPDERALFDAFLVANDFRHALVDAHTVGRVCQIRERLKAVVQDFHQLENEAAAKADALCKD